MTETKGVLPLENERIMLAFNGVESVKRACFAKTNVVDEILRRRSLAVCVFDYNSKDRSINLTSKQNKMN